MIKILDSGLNLITIVKDLIDPFRFEEINGENTLTFSTILTEKVGNNVDENCIVELDDDYFDIAYYSKDINEDGTITMANECEHVSYRLNNPEYNKDYFTYTGTPNYILGKILEGTGFTVGTVEFANSITYSAQEKKSRRAILMEFVALLGGEVDFDKFTISILQKRGSRDLKIFTKGKNVKVVSKVYDGREETPVIAYTCTPILLPNKPVNLGDYILLVQPELGIQDKLRIVRYGYNPVDKMEAEFEIANYINGLEDDIYRIETTTVAKEKVYNGCRIGPDEGFVAERSDGLAKTIMNATEGISIYSDVGNGLDRNFYVDLNGKIQAKEVEIDGIIKGGSIIANTTINVGTDLFVGRNIYLEQGTNNDKRIEFTDYGSGGAYLGYYNDGLFKMHSWGDLELYAFDKIILDSDIEFDSWNIDVFASTIDFTLNSGATVYLPDKTLINGAPGENLVATIQDIIDEINQRLQQHVQQYHSL